MALFQGTWSAQSLGIMTGVSILYPEWIDSDRGVPVLYLLHGSADNHTAWVRYTNIDRFAGEAGIAVVMPEVQTSFYCDMQMGGAFFRYLVDELPQLCRKVFHLSDRREDTYIAGLSMGGYGAFRAALARPQQYGAAASFSGAVDMQTIIGLYPDMFAPINGGHMRPEEDVFRLATQLREQGEEPPRLYMTCGESDEILLRDNRRLAAHLDTLDIPYTLEHWPGGHSWDFWDVSVQKALRFFQETRQATK